MQPPLPHPSPLLWYPPLFFISFPFSPHLLANLAYWKIMRNMGMREGRVFFESKGLKHEGWEQGTGGRRVEKRGKGTTDRGAKKRLNRWIWFIYNEISLRLYGAVCSIQPFSAATARFQPLNIPEMGARRCASIIRVLRRPRLARCSHFEREVIACCRFGESITCVRVLSSHYNFLKKKIR